MKDSWKLAVTAIVLTVAALLTGCSGAASLGKLRFGVAGEGGVYHALGQAYAALENETSNGQVEVKTTAGSAANLRLLMGDYLQLAVAQADLAQDAVNHRGIFETEEDEGGFSDIAALYTEACQVVVRADSGIESIEDLQGKTVSVGEKESGSEQNAKQILAAYGLSDQLVGCLNLNYADAAAQLKAGKIDALFVTCGAPFEALTELAEECDIRLLPIEGSAAQRLLSLSDAYQTTSIPAGTYAGIEEEVPTVGVKALLLVSNAVPAKQVQRLTELLFTGREGLEEQLGIPLDAEPDAVEGVGIPFHAGAAAYYKAAGITVE